MLNVREWDCLAHRKEQERKPLTLNLGSQKANLDEQVEQIYEQTRTAICSYLLCLGVPSSQAPEVTQEVFLRLYQSMKEGQTIENKRAWLFRVAHNLGLTVRAREKSFQTVSPDWDRFVHPSGLSPEREMLDREKNEKVAAAVDKLSAQQRNCLYLRSEGLRYREIAAVIGISPSAVNEFLRRAISRLAEALSE